MASIGYNTPDNVPSPVNPAELGTRWFLVPCPDDNQWADNVRGSLLNLSLYYKYSSREGNYQQREEAAVVYAAYWSQIMDITTAITDIVDALNLANQRSADLEQTLFTKLSEIDTRLIAIESTLQAMLVQQQLDGVQLATIAGAL